MRKSFPSFLSNFLLFFCIFSVEIFFIIKFLLETFQFLLLNKNQDQITLKLRVYYEI